MNAIQKQLRAVLAVIGVGSATGIAPVSAIGLGDIEVHSYLNDPLSATVALATTPREEVTAGCIRLVSPSRADGARNDLFRLRDALLELVPRRGGGLLRITTREAVVEPVLTLVLEVDCPGSGRFVREYTLLLDPPLPGTLQPAYARAPAPPERSPVPARRIGGVGGEWRVKRGETLSKIAAGLIPGDRRAQFRLIEEIVAINPDVFPDGDPNRLPAGAHLRLPVSVADRATATTRSSEPVAAVHTRPARQSEAPSAAAPASGSPRLTLSTQEQSASPEVAAETARMVADTRRLILETERQYANAEELKARLRRLENQIVLLERALSSLDRLTGPAASEGQIGQPEENAPPEPAPPEPERSTVAVVTPQPAQAAAPPVPVETPAPARSAAEQEATPAGYWGWLLAFLVIGAALLWLRMRRGAGEESDSFTGTKMGLDELVPEPGFATGGGAMQGGGPVLAHKEVVFADDPLAGLPEDPDAGAPDEAPEADPSQEVPILDHELTQQMEDELLLEDFDFQGRDPDSSREVSNILVRAEFHTLLKQTDSAIELLRESIESGDSRREDPALWLMLLRLYRREGDREPFMTLRREFDRLFNIAVPQWDEPPPSQEGRASTLEQDFPRILHRVVELWGSPNCALFLDGLLRDDREGTRRGFDIHVAEELMMLRGVLQSRHRF